MLVLGLLFALIAATLDSTWGLAAGAVRAWFATSPARLRLVGGTGGLTMVGLGIGLRVDRPRSLSGKSAEPSFRSRRASAAISHSNAGTDGARCGQPLSTPRSCQ